MKFERLPRKLIRDFIIHYSSEDQAIEVIPTRESVGYSLSINEIQLELNENGYVDHLWGFCPDIKWLETECIPPRAEFGELKVSSVREMVPGASVKIRKERFPVFYNPTHKLLCIGQVQNTNCDCDFVRIEDKLVIGFTPSTIHCIWVQLD